MELIVPSDIIDVFDIMHDKSGSVVWEQAIQLVEDIRKVDAVPVVRCKDCRWKEREEPGMVYCPATVGGWVDEDWFCKGGERSEE